MTRPLVGFLSCVMVAPAVAAPPPKADALAQWGKVIDPDKDCEVVAEKGRLSVTVPSTNHNLHAERGMNAPRVLKEVDGDFTATVRVTFELDPGKNPTGKSATAGYYAGLLLWGGEKSFVRLERNARWQSPNGPLVCFTPGFEYWQDGRMKVASPGGGDTSFFKAKSTWLRYERKKDTLTASLSHDGKTWETLKPISIDVPTKAQIGVAAINSSDRTFVAEFDEYSLLTGK
jgi:hypothetical protein